MHIAESFRKLSEPGLNFLENMAEGDFRNFREVAIGMVLATDISKHFVNLARFKN